MIRRTPLKRSTKPIARSPLKRGAPPRKRRPGPPRRGPASIPADQWRNPAYLAFLRQCGMCVACAYAADPPQYYRAGRCEPMHGPPNGRSQKGPDAEAIPGCREHHEEQTRLGWPAFEALYRFRRSIEANAWWDKFEEGRRK